MIKKEIKSLTGIRGIAALYVAIGHFFDLSNVKIIVPGYLKPVIFHYGLSVDLFFILSSYLLILTCHNSFKNNISAREYCRFMSKRFARIYPLYFVFLTFVFVFLNKFENTGDYLKGLSLMLSLNGFRQTLFVLWSLRAEWITYLLFPIIIFFAGKVKPQVIFILLVIGFLLFYNYSLYAFSSGLESLFRCWFDYGLGIGIYKIAAYYSGTNSIKIKKFKYTDILIAFILSILLFINNTEALIIIMLALFILSLVLYQGIASVILEIRVIHYLGLISYSIYLTHPILMYYIRYFTYLPFYVLFFAYLVMLIIISGFTYKYIEVKGMKFLKEVTLFKRRDTARLKV